MNTTRIKDFGIRIGSFPSGKHNNIADVKGVTVGHCTIDNERHKTGVTVILPRPENIFQNKLIASAYVLNGFGKTTGLLQIQNSGIPNFPDKYLKCRSGPGCYCRLYGKSLSERKCSS